MRIIAILVVGSFLFLREQMTHYLPFLGLMLWPHSLSAGIVADIVTATGMVVMIWSRITLSDNWSANIVFKEGHELITNGPYAFVRHPIYSGLLLMILGTAVYSGTLDVFLLFGLFFVGARYKAYKEEKLLVTYFPNSYPSYVKRVKALVPFIF
jgi:protein-S-isoprenylcysteine O-methyltransferase Ste14